MQKTKKHLKLGVDVKFQKVSVGMKANLLILDEPTDGFSMEQLFRVREILNELQCPGNQKVLPITSSNSEKVRASEIKTALE